MRLNRIHTSKDSRNKLGILQSRTGLLPNILCRIGLMLSLAEPNQPEVNRDTTDGSELHRDTLMGEWDPLIVALLEEWCLANGIETDNDNTRQILQGTSESRGTFALCPSEKIRGFSKPSLIM